MSFFSKARIKSTEIMEQAVSYLNKKYDQAESIFSIASPFGQLLNVIANISELIFTYISHTAEELNIQTAQNHESIFGLSRLTGHDPFRGSSAHGTITLTPNISASALVEGQNIIIKNFTSLIIKETGEKYFLNLDNDYLRLNINENIDVSVNIMQGEIESQTFISSGEPLQSFNPIVKTMTDNDNVSVTVNGKEWKKVDSLYDMPSDDEYGSGECYMVKSSINVGLTIIFGNGSFGTIPTAGSEIIVTYIKTSGDKGNVYTNNMNITFIDTGLNEYGDDVDLNNVLNVGTIYPPMLGSDYESPEFTKLIAPKNSRTYVLSNPESYETFLSRYNQFSFIKAYNTKDDDYIEDDNITYIKAIPNIKRKLSSHMDYFDLPISEFYLSEYEANALQQAIENSGRTMVGSEIEIIKPSIQRFVINIVIRYFAGSNKANIKSNIRQLLSTYFLNINRKDIIPLSDMISLVEGIEGVDTCDVFFITEKNENAKIYGKYTTLEKEWKQLKQTYVEKEIKVKFGVDPKVDIDNFGNIIIGENELYIPKGGWVDYDGNEYSENPQNGELGPLNIFFLNEVDYSTYNLSMQKKLNTLLKSNY